MPTMTTGSLGDAFVIPATQLGPITDRVQNDSVLASLSPEQPTLFGDVQAVRMTRKPRAQIVAEGANKASDTGEWDSVMASPVKIQTTVRFTDEVKWLDEDHRLGIVDALTSALGESIARAVDLIGIHGINPIDGTQAASITRFLNQTPNRIIDQGNPQAELENAVSAIASNGTYVPTGVAMTPAYAFSTATQRYDSGTLQGQKINPDMGFGFNSASWNGLSLATSTAVSGQPEAADGAPATLTRAVLGDFSQMKWGFQRRIPVTTIEYGDPDGGGDLQRNNQIAYRAEAVLYVAIFDLMAFATVDEAATP